MSDVIAAASLPKTLVARLRELEKRPGLQVNRIPVLTTTVGQREILDTAGDAVADLNAAPLATLAVLSPRRPAVDGVAWLDFETVAYYTAGANAFASVGTFTGNPQFQPYLRLTLAQAPTGRGVLVTCRATSIAVGPHYPGYYRVEGPGVAASFEDTARPTTFTFVVPAGGSGPVEIKIYTDADRIQLWAFYDCTITQM
ncbi:hypothetical protein MAAFP003_1556 [Mycobacterium ahvazicum]|uniref:Uncharacterized protein n=1 Tax=Mycobacterium ahvazicum TaxID=1964395 RepID=A0A2K4Y7W2_9MYCO|nr:hypothetical protein [Mycobacterium ahvazicum]SOX52888.1 hypothetical protein MAAFP003_1556 [Mycobacterium ahvazicum]